MDLMMISNSNRADQSEIYFDNEKLKVYYFSNEFYFWKNQVNKII